MQRFKQYRFTHRLKLADAARRLGVTASTVSRWESGALRPSFEKLERIAGLTGWPVEELVREVHPDVFATQR